MKGKFSAKHECVTRKLLKKLKEERKRINKCESVELSWLKCGENFSHIFAGAKNQLAIKSEIHTMHSFTCIVSDTSTEFDEFV